MAPLSIIVSVGARWELHSEDVEHIPAFAASEYTQDALPSDEVEQAALLAFLTRHYYPLTPSDVAEYVEHNTVVSANTDRTETALQSLADQNLLEQEEDGYTLNASNQLVVTVQDAYVERQVSDEYGQP